MEVKILGDLTIRVKELHHYSFNKKSSIPRFKYWTDYKTENSSDAKAMTGSTVEFRYRATVKISDNLINKYFVVGQTRVIPRVGHAIEYQNRSEILKEHLVIVKLSS